MRSKKPAAVPQLPACPCTPQRPSPLGQRPVRAWQPVRCHGRLRGVMAACAVSWRPAWQHGTQPVTENPGIKPRHTTAGLKGSIAYCSAGCTGENSTQRAHLIPLPCSLYKSKIYIFILFMHIQYYSLCRLGSISLASRLKVQEKWRAQTRRGVVAPQRQGAFGMEVCFGIKMILKRAKFTRG